MTQAGETASSAGFRHPTALAWLLGVSALAYVVLSVLAGPTWFLNTTVRAPDAPITEVYVDGDPDSTRLEVGVGTCNQDPQVTAQESASEVRLNSNEPLPRGNSDDCADYDIVMLDRPLGDRTVIDDATDDVVDVRRGDQS